MNVCHVCGCTDDHACRDANGEPCWWVNKEKDLCSTCVVKVYSKQQKEKVGA